MIDKRLSVPKIVNTFLNDMLKFLVTILPIVDKAGIFLPFQNRDPGQMILGKIIRISVQLGK